MSLAQTLRVVFAGDVKAFQEAGAHVEKEANKLAGQLKQIFSAAAATALVKEVLDLASSINDASQAAGVGAEAWQEWLYAAEQTGAGAGELQTAMRKLQDTIGAVEPTKQAQIALDRLGLSFDELKAMSPEEQFEAVATAIGKVQDPASQSQIAIELFGRSGTVLIPMAEDFAKLTDEARKFGQVMSGETVKALDDAGDAIDRTKKAFMVYVGEAIGGIGWLAKQWGEMSAGISAADQNANDRMVASLKAAAAEKAKAAQAAKDAQIKAAEDVKKAEEAAAKEREQAEKDLQAANTKAREAAAKEAERLAKEIADTEKDIADTREKLEKARTDQAQSAAKARAEAEIESNEENAERYREYAEEYKTEAAKLEAELAEMLKRRGESSSSLSRMQRDNARAERKAKREAAREEEDIAEALYRKQHGLHLSMRQDYLANIDAKKKELQEKRDAEDKAILDAQTAEAAAKNKQDELRAAEVKAYKDAQDAMVAKLTQTLDDMLAQIKELTGEDYSADINANAETETADTALNGVASDRTSKLTVDADTSSAEQAIADLGAEPISIPAALDPPELKAALDLTLNAPLNDISQKLDMLATINESINNIVGTAA